MRERRIFFSKNYVGKVIAKRNTKASAVDPGFLSFAVLATRARAMPCWSLTRAWRISEPFIEKAPFVFFVVFFLTKAFLIRLSSACGYTATCTRAYDSFFVAAEKRDARTLIRNLLARVLYLAHERSRCASSRYFR